METRFDELKRYVRFTDLDATRIATLLPLARSHFVRISEEFYDRIREHEAAHAVFVDEAQIARLQRSLVAWLERLLAGRYDERYFEQTAHIGRVHVRVGLPQRYMFTAMALIRSSLHALAAPLADPGVGEALDRLLDLELAIMLETYREDLVHRVERVAALEREELSRRVALAERRHATAFEHTDVVMIGLDQTGVIVLFNRRAEAVTGYARDEALGRRFAELLLFEEERSVFASAIGDADRLELPLRTRAGKRRDMRWAVVAVGPGDAGQVETLMTGQDVTDERSARKLAEQQERLAAIGTLSAGLAHEIRNPLNGAQLHISFLERVLKNLSAREVSELAEALEATQVVGDELKRLSRLVTEFLDFARPRPLVRAPTSLRALAERARSLVAPAAAATPGRGEVELALDLPTTDVTIEVDRDRIVQVLLNLLQNAIDAVAGGPRGGEGRVVLRARREPHVVWLEVEDDGPGLPESGDRDRIFDPFFSTKETGTGLGLAIAYRVVIDHRGKIEVMSAPGQTRFRVVLPLDAPAVTSPG